MSARLRSALPYLAAFVAGFLLVTAGALAAQDTTVVVPPDKTGVFGPIINMVWPVIVTFLTSLTVKGISAANTWFASKPQAVKWVALYVFALGYNQLAGWLGITALNPLAPALGLSLIQMIAAALVFKFGQHPVPVIAESRRATSDRF